MADSPVLFVYYRPDNDDSYPGVPNRHITEADWARFSPSQRRTVEQATTQEGYTRRKVWVHRDLVDETEQERAEREAAEQAAREAYERGQSIVRWRDFESLVPGPGEVIVGGIDGATSTPIAQVLMPGNRTITFGDSITKGGAGQGAYPAPNDTLWVYSSSNWDAYAAMISGGAIRLIRNAGIPSNTVAQMLARIDADVIDHRPDRVIVMGGTNDLPATSVDDIVSTLETIWDRLLGAGVVVYPATIPPRANYAQKATELNARIRAEAERRGLRLLDMYDVLVNPETGEMAAEDTTDGIHLTSQGAEKVGRYVAARLEDQYSAFAARLTTSTNDSANLLQNGVFLGDSNGDGIADGWSASSDDGNTVMSLEPGSGPVVGNWQVITRTADSGRFFFQWVMSGFAPGDTLEFASRLNTSGIATTGLTVSLRLQHTSATNFAHFMTGLAADFTGVMRFRAIVPDGVTQIRPVVGLASTGTGVVKVAQMTLINLTRLGLA